MDNLQKYKNQKVRREEVFKGTPDQFQTFVKQLANRLRAVPGGKFSFEPFMLPGDIGGKKQLDAVELMININSYPGNCGWVTAQDTTDKKSLITLYYPDSACGGVAPLWNLIMAEAERQGWVDSPKYYFDLTSSRILSSYDFPVEITSKEHPQTVTSISNKEGMRERRKKRADLFRNIKEKNPSFTYEKVASQAQTQAHKEIEEELRSKMHNWTEDKLDNEASMKFAEKWGKPYFTKDDVRNDYRDMNWEWIASKRIK